MSKLASILRDKDIVFFQAVRMSLDPYFYEPFQDTDERFDTSVIFETDNSDTIRKVDVYDHSFFQYFLDGSRKTYKIGDIITKDNKFVPVVTGQLGAVCCHRNSQHKMEKYKSLSRIRSDRLFIVSLRFLSSTPLLAWIPPEGQLNPTRTGFRRS